MDDRLNMLRDAAYCLQHIERQITSFGNGLDRKAQSLVIICIVQLAAVLLLVGSDPDFQVDEWTRYLIVAAVAMTTGSLLFGGYALQLPTGSTEFQDDIRFLTSGFAGREYESDLNQEYARFQVECFEKSIGSATQLVYKKEFGVDVAMVLIMPAVACIIAVILFRIWQ